MELNDQFLRWKLLQSLFEGELPASDIEDILILSLDAYLRHGPTSASADNKNENGGNASPVLTREQRSMMADLIHDMTYKTLVDDLRGMEDGERIREVVERGRRRRRRRRKRRCEK